MKGRQSTESPVSPKNDTLSSVKESHENDQMEQPPDLEKGVNSTSVAKFSTSIK